MTGYMYGSERICTYRKEKQRKRRKIQWKQRSQQQKN
nr:MAG TPA: hypothetical protein [Siphoviridae sp. ctCjJ10]DAJ87745.1 MAG TPA: hypothetical protein [Caudoviricetes sp.]